MRILSIILATLTGIASFLVLYIAWHVFVAICTMAGFFLAILALVAN